jgi:hypothetical protein
MEDEKEPDQVGDGEAVSSEWRVGSGGSSAEMNKSDIITSDLPTGQAGIQNMEVHHHPDIEKKGIKEYFFTGKLQYRFSARLYLTR